MYVGQNSLPLGQAWCHGGSAKAWAVSSQQRPAIAASAKAAQAKFASRTSNFAQAPDAGRDIFRADVSVSCTSAAVTAGVFHQVLRALTSPIRAAPVEPSIEAVTNQVPRAAFVQAGADDGFTGPVAVIDGTTVQDIMFMLGFPSICWGFFVGLLDNRGLSLSFPRISADQIAHVRRAQIDSHEQRNREIRSGASSRTLLTQFTHLIQ